MTPRGSKNQSILLRIAPTTPHRRLFATVTSTVSNPSTKTTIQYVVSISKSLRQPYPDADLSATEIIKIVWTIKW